MNESQMIMNGSVQRQEELRGVGKNVLWQKCNGFYFFYIYNYNTLADLKDDLVICLCLCKRLQSMKLYLFWTYCQQIQVVNIRDGWCCLLCCTLKSKMCLHHCDPSCLDSAVITGSIATQLFSTQHMMLSSYCKSVAVQSFFVSFPLNNCTLRMYTFVNGFTSGFDM